MYAIAAAVRRHLPEEANPRVGLVLGSGLGEWADGLSDAVRMRYEDVGLPPVTVPGHAGQLVHGRGPAGIEVLALQGRIHRYEGHELAVLALPVQALVACGCRTLILTNAAGSLRQDLQPGQLVLISDHINFMGGSPLIGENDPALGPRFPDMSAVYDPGLRALAQEAGRAIGLPLASGVYAALTGPQYETPAEIRMLRTLGADLVGMSTVPEAIAARHMGARVLGLSCVTNLAAGLSATPLSHAEVTETAARARGDFARLLDAILLRLQSGAVHA
ncbi:MAG: purine-nucleoside phosphorylase [Myxococcota bacterium]|nr:purine-nucleoside phosphorylase [Myxococcota bacterium]